MKSLAIWVSLSLLVACRASLAFELPANLSGADVPDYEAILKVEQPGLKPKIQSKSVLHMDGWSKTRQSDDLFPSTTIENKDVQILIFGSLDGTPDGMRVARMDSASRSYSPVQDIRATDEYDLQAGEKCQFFAFRRGPKQEIGGVEYLSCFTADGIEIADRALSFRGQPLSTTSLVKLIRRRIKWEEVLPKNAWFQARFWLEPMQEATAAEKNAYPDFVATLQGSFGKLMLWRRHYPWNYQDTRELDGRRTIKIWNEREFRGLYFIALEGGRFDSLFVMKKSKSLLSLGSFGFWRAPEPMGKIDAVLGEDCRWFDMEPNVSDTQHHQCRTADNIVMDVTDSRSRFTAISVMRRPVTIEEILPEKAILDPEAWGIRTAGY